MPGFVGQDEGRRPAVVSTRISTYGALIHIGYNELILDDNQSPNKLAHPSSSAFCCLAKRNVLEEEVMIRADRSQPVQLFNYGHRDGTRPLSKDRGLLVCKLAPAFKSYGRPDDEVE
ncbi:hypothetical protein LTR10_012472 [Elasticomyces elasticus]|nr:hypothetical protein LTR10_012472 [Elasticomyces elasticus]